MPYDNSYARLPERFYQRITPAAVNNPRLIRVNTELAAELDFPLPKEEQQLAAIFSGNTLPQGADPLAMVYAGHQFGNFVPRLGDGRAVLLGEFVNSKGARFDIQLKGSGQTMFSRNGDGRSPLGPVIREYMISEAMYRLGIPSTRSLAMASSGESVYRETELPGAVLTRVASSHIRIGTFEYFASREDHDALKILADYTIERHYPQLFKRNNPYAALLEKVCSQQAELVAKWMRVGFIHGVMNTDNTTVSGETIDYGPCAFMDGYDPGTVFSSIDHYGRYAYGRQPTIAQWNLAVFGGCLLPLIHTDVEQGRAIAEDIIKGYRTTFRGAYYREMCSKIGFAAATEPAVELIEKVLEVFSAEKTDFTLAFRRLSQALENDSPDLLSLFKDCTAIDSWLTKWRNELASHNIAPDRAREIMDNANPAYIPRNHRVEQAISAAVEHDDFSLMDRLLAVLRNPYQESPDYEEYMLPPPPSEQVYQTFCGT